MSRIRWYGPTVILILTILIVMVMGPSIVQKIAWAQESAKVQFVRDQAAADPALAKLSDAFRNVAKIVEPSVVAIQVSAKASPRRITEDDAMRRFFGPRGWPQSPFDLPQDDGEDQSPQQEPGIQDYNRYNVPRAYANGSGWVYDEAGHIITNRHVVNGADVITVRFNDGSERTAKLVGEDDKTDIAVIKVDGARLIPAQLAKEPVEQGDIVFAFGSPFRFEFSMSQGIVSAKGRQLHIVADGRGYENFIQTDAAINPGNSGGPLTNIQGDVVGMNTAIASRTGANNGLGFAIPIEMVAPVVDQIIKTGKVTRGYLGIYIDDLDPKMAESFGFKGHGVLVNSLIDGGPAEKAGIKSGDIITKIDGKDVRAAEELRRRVSNYEPGRKVDIELFRAGKTQRMQAVVAELPASVQRASTDSADRGGEAKPSDKVMDYLRRAGIENVTDFTAELAQRRKVELTPGVLVTQVRPGSDAADKGIRPGSVIVEVMNTRIKTVDELTTALTSLDMSKPVRLSVSEGGVKRFVLLEVPQ